MHNRHSRHSHHDTILAGLTAFLLLTFGPIQADEVESEETDPDYELFEIFLSGNAEERLLIAEDCDELADEMLEYGENLDETVDQLAALLDTEPDPWIRFNCLLSLADYSAESLLTPIFVDALIAGHPIDRWPVLAWLAEEQGHEALPHLQALWPAQDRPWLRPLLVEALANHGSMEHLDEFLHLARSKKREEEKLARSAITALVSLGDESAIPTLLRLSGADSPLAARATQALSAWPDSAPAREGLLRLLERGKPVQRSSALDSLHQFDHPDVLKARLQIVEDTGAGEDLRTAAIEGLSAEGDPLVFPVLRAVATGASPGNESLVKAAWRILRFNATMVEDESLIAFIKQHPAPVTRYTVFSCGGFLTFGERGEGPALRATPHNGRSLRCWGGPDQIIPWEDELTERFPAGRPVNIDGVYEGAAGTLVRDADEICWLPLEQLAWRNLEPGESDLSLFWDSPTTADFDIPLDETYSETALTLQDAGLLDLFDPGPGTIGAALVIGENRAQLRDLLLDLSEAGDAPLLEAALEDAWYELEEEAEKSP